MRDLRGEDALDALADMLIPLSVIFKDKNIVNAFRSGDTITAAKIALKEYKKEVLECMAILDGENPETYNPGIMVLPVRLLEILNSPELTLLFPSPRPKSLPAFSGRATENITEEGH